jgi:IPT/TIG domain-containing protein
MTVLKRHIGRRVAAVGAAVALLVLGLATPAYAAIPTVTAVTPPNAALGCEVTVTGTNFQTVANGGPADDVKFGGTSGTGLTIDADTQLEVTVPAGAGTGSNDVVVHNTTGNSAAFTYSTAAAATCPGVPTPSPTSGIVGSTVTISGTFNATVTGVRFNTSTLVTPTNASTTSATAVVPAGATTGPIHVYTAAGQKTGGTFTVNPVPAPTISSFTPIFGPVGTSVKITGTNFSGTVSGANFTTSVVKFNTTNATSFHVDSATQITATVPTGATTGKISVTTPGGTATSVASFTVSIAHSRSVTLRLSKHVVAKGAVNVGDTFTACEASVPVKIQRKTKSGWKNVGSATTSASGSYSKKVKDKPGKYRAQVKKFTPDAGVNSCSKATSPVRKHSHH